MSGKSDKKKPLVPSLRFPEFREAGAWEVKRLAEIGEIVTGTTPSTKKAEYYEDGIHLWVTPTDIGEEKDITETKIKLSEDGLQAGRFVPRNSLLVTCIASIGKNAILRMDGSCNQQINAITRFQGACVDFLYYLIERNTPILLNTAGQGGMAILNKNDFSNLRFPFPALREQQKIAHCLSSLDEVIGLQAKKVQALKQHKKGLMQQLLPAEGETTPRLRFPDFREAGAWEVKRLGKLVETITPPKKLQTTEYLPSGQFPIIDQSPNDVCGWTDDETAMINGEFPLVIFGDHTCVVKLVEGPFAQGADGIKVLSPTSEVDARFLFLSLQADPIEQKGYKRHFSTLKEKLIPFPPKDTDEQQKIAHCLSSLDEVIGLESHKLDALKNLKKGLMQQLFPQEVA